MDNSESELADRLVQQLTDEYGVSVRCVIVYRLDTATIHYLRDGIDERLAKDRALNLNILEQQSTITQSRGRLNASVQYFNVGCVIHIASDDGVGYAITVEHDVEDISEFINQCMGIVGIDEAGRSAF